jgi:hypothetical protein
MISEDEAKIIALELARTQYAPLREGDAIVLDDSRTERSRIGWVFWPESQHALETDDDDSWLARASAIFVHRFEAWAAPIDGRTPTDFEVLRCPGPDWPEIAWLTMPLVFVTQALGWWLGWMALDAVLDWLQIRELPIVGILGVLGVMFVLGIVPIHVALTKTEFVHLRRWLPLVIVMGGTAVGELLSSVWVIHSALERPDLGRALSLLPDYYRFLSWDYLWWRLAVAALVGAATWATATNDARGRKALWRDD